MIIVPVNKVYAAGHAVYRRLGYVYFFTVIFAAVGNTDKHIRPHHTLKAVFSGNFKHFFKMTV